MCLSGGLRYGLMRDSAHARADPAPEPRPVFEKGVGICGADLLPTDPEGLLASSSAAVVMQRSVIGMSSRALRAGHSLHPSIAHYHALRNTPQHAGSPVQQSCSLKVLARLLHRTPSCSPGSNAPPVVVCSDTATLELVPVPRRRTSRLRPRDPSSCIRHHYQ